MQNASTNDGVTFTITIIITTIASIITTIAIIITIIVAILHQMRPAQLNSTVPQSNYGSAPAMMMTFNMWHVSSLHSTFMNELRSDLMIKECMTEWIIMSPSLSPIISTVLHQVATYCSESEHSSDRIEPLLHQWLIACHRLIACIAYIIDW